jgi:hypothetical protein
MCQLYHVVLYYCCSIYFIVVQLSFNSFAVSLFIVHCSKEKYSILILDCIPGISILLYVRYLFIIIHASQ